jgi:hypothetical protein
MIAYRNIPQLLLFGILISFFSCAEDDTYEWMWGDSWATEHWSMAFVGYNLGCALLGDIIEFTPNSITFSCGYRIDELTREAKHYNGKEDVADGPLDDFEITGVVLLALATQNGLEKAAGDIGLEFVSDVLRIAKTVDEIDRPEEVFFENVSLPVDNPKCSEELFEKCWGEVHPTFIICWDNSKTGVRAYQFLRPIIRSPVSSSYEIHPGCDAISYHPLFGDHPKQAQLLLVSWPLLDKYAKEMGVAPDPENWTDWIDEILPRP